MTVEKELCTSCGLCIGICHEGCISLAGGAAGINTVLCSTCGQCIAVCPRGALSWKGVPSAPYDAGRLPAPEQMDELFKQRRTVREFKPDRVDRGLIEEIVAYAAYAPTHNFGLWAIVVDEAKTIELIDAVLFRYITRVYKLIFKPRAFRALLRVMPRSYREEYDKARPKLEHALEKGMAYANKPPVLVFLVGDKRIPLSVESAQYALYNICLYAQSKGLGSRNLVGNQMFYNRSKEIRRRLGLARDERIFATAGLGYPAVKFCRKVEGRKPDIRWLG